MNAPTNGSLNSVYSIVSIGTNSTRALVADLSQPRPRIVYANSIGTRIGEGLKDRGKLNEHPMHRTLDAVREHRRIIQEQLGTAFSLKHHLFAVATSALRRASNAGTFGQAVEGILGVPLHVLTGEEEAVSSYRGAITVFEDHATVGVLDIGGGSTEYAIGHGSFPERVVSCEIGAVRLTEACPELAGAKAAAAEARARSIARSVLTPIAEFPHVEHLAVVGGSASTAVSLLEGNRDRFESRIVARSEIEKLFDRLRGLTTEERRELPGMNPQRADILPAGLIILDTVFEIAAHSTATATTFDLPLGYLLIQNEAMHE